MEINILDMGESQYGDCLLVTKNTKRILVDGAHPEDTESIKQQLALLLNESPPHNIDLMVVTHCHRDHIGCLPRLVRDGVLKIKVALVADEKLGFARTADGDSPADALFTQSQKALLTALMEEDYTNMPQDKLQQVIADAGGLEDGYRSMLKQLSQIGTTVIRYKGLETNGLSQIEDAFKDFGFKILGPTQDHLLLCTQALGNEADANARTISNNISDADAGVNLAGAYEEMVRAAADNVIEGADMVGPGAAKNNQSMVIKLESDGWTALLAGDMQFSKPEVRGLNDSMKELLDKVNEAGPYDFIKLTHHTASNGLSQKILDTWLTQTGLYAHTGGFNDPGHPNKKMLDLLKENTRNLVFTRTDRNGIITVRKIRNNVVMEISKGRFNDFTPNIRVDGGITPPPPQQPQAPPLPLPPQPEPQVNRQQNNQFVEVTAKIPHTSTRVTITVDVDPEKKKFDNPGPVTQNDLFLPTGRLANLLFVTSSELLRKKIGIAVCNQLFTEINKQTGTTLVDIPATTATAVEAAAIVRSKLAATTKGIVIIGGYDIVPAMQLDVLDPILRQALRNADKLGSDDDDFTVWTDDIYGDLDGDSLAEIPVSRIPDGESPELLINAFNASPFQQGKKFAIRNIARPFANTIFDIIPGAQGNMEVSASFGSGNVLPGSSTGAVYFMLHGADFDGSRFWGETQFGGSYEAFNISNISKLSAGTIVFSGCCWGALTVDSLAYQKVPRSLLKSRTPQQSIPLSFLLNGAVAFIGCTGTHYSPLAAPYNYYGKPMHDDFWKAISNNMQPAQALLYAKKEYLKNMPHGRKDAVSQAVEMKILRQFTCLGLGW